MGTQTEPRVKQTKKLLKWAGGKSFLSPTLATLYEPYRSTHRWVEWFCGSLGATIGVAPEQASLNDVNKYLINFYQYIVRVGHIPESYRDEFMLHEDDQYYRNRDRFNELRDSPLLDDREEAARLLYYLNHSCFNGLTRYSLKSGFNVPIGAYDAVHYETDFRDYQAILKNWQFSAMCWSAMAVEPNDFIYIDPPYDGKATAFTTYFGKFDWVEQVALCDRLATLPNPIVASNLATDRVIELYESRGFTVGFVDAPRSVSAKGEGRGKVREVLALRNLSPEFPDAFGGTVNANKDK